MSEDGTVTKYFPSLALGQMSSAVPRSLDPDSGAPYIWRDSMNFMVRNNRLQRRGGFAALASQPTAATPTGGALMKGELPLIIMTDTLGSSDFIVLITSMQILVYPNATTGWVAATPRYSTGTVAATNGSAAIVGTTTAWSTRFITPGQYMLLDSTWYRIANVNSDTSITLASNYTGATGAGKSYVITRNWLLHTDVSTGSIHQLNPNSPDIFATIFNGDLYVAGTTIGGADGTVKCAVIKVADIYNAASPTTYLTGSNAYVAGLDTISGLTRIAGLQALQDGRIVFGGNTNNVYYSSHLNTAVWTTSPGGQVPISMGNGRITTLGMVGNMISVHYPNGIVLGRPTGQSDPPLTWQKSLATKGCDAHRTLKSAGGIEIFMTSDNDVCVFSGDDGQVKSLGDGEIRYRMMATANASQDYFFASFDPERMEYMLWQGGTPSSLAWLYQFDSNAWWPMGFPMPIWAAFGANHPVAGYNSARVLCGFSTVNWVTGGIFSNILFQLDDSIASDPISYPVQAQPTYTLTTDDLDFGDPLLYKTAQTVIIWLTPRVTNVTNPSPEQVLVSVSRDGGVSWTNLSVSLTFDTNLSFSIPIQACFDPSDPGAAHVLRFKFTFGTTAPYPVTGSPERLAITVVRGGLLKSTEL